MGNTLASKLLVLRKCLFSRRKTLFFRISCTTSGPQCRPKSPERNSLKDPIWLKLLVQISKSQIAWKDADYSKSASGPNPKRNSLNRSSLASPFSCRTRPRQRNSNSQVVNSHHRPEATFSFLQLFEFFCWKTRLRAGISSVRMMLSSSY